MKIIIKVIFFLLSSFTLYEDESLKFVITNNEDLCIWRKYLNEILEYSFTFTNDDDDLSWCLYE